MTRVPDFENLYAQDPDPWDVATSWYEQRKLGILLATLRRPRCRLAWDAGSGTGELAARLTQRCDVVLATDASARAVELTGARVSRSVPTAGACGNHAGRVVVARSALPSRPAELTTAPDLVVFSELLYYLDDAERRATWALLDSVCAPETDVLSVHWRPKPEDAWLSGEAVQRELNDHLVDAGWFRVVTHTDVEFVLACWSRDVPQRLGRHALETP